VPTTWHDYVLTKHLDNDNNRNVLVRNDEDLETKYYGWLDSQHCRRQSLIITEDSVPGLNLASLHGLARPDSLNPLFMDGSYCFWD